MFKRLTVIIITVFILVVVALTLVWQSVPGVELYGNKPVTQVYRISQDLGGKWNSYTSLRRAWSQETRKINGEAVLNGLIQQDSIILPSSQGFQVAAKKFNVTGKWGSRTAQLTIEGVYGKVRIYLNGIDEFSFVGEIEGNGGAHHIELSPTRLDFSQENILFLQMAEGTMQQSKLFGDIWPEQGRVTGQIRLEGIPETSINLSRTQIKYENVKKQVIVHTAFQHHGLMEQKPLVINAVIKNGAEKVAECLLPLNSNENSSQTVDLVFNLPEITLWSMENPHLYDLEITLTNNRGEFDSVHLPIGFTQIAPADKQYIQAGILTKEQEHQIRNQRLMDQWLQSFKEQGNNVLYFMGFIPDESWLYAADQMGIGVWLELPAYYLPTDRIPDPTVFQDLILMSKRHPSVVAWTAGIGLEGSIKTDEYLQRIKDLTSPLPVFYVPANSSTLKNSLGEEWNLVVTREGFESSWGQAVFISDQSVNQIERPSSGWKNEKTVSILLSVWLLMVNFQIVRGTGWSYKDLISTKPKRSVRVALFWNCLAALSRMATVGALFISILYRTPPKLPPWIPYDLDWLKTLQAQPPLLMWLSISLLLMVLRLLQAGVASPFFPSAPEALGLVCWLERRYRWIIVVGFAWVGTMYGVLWYIPFVLYAFFVLLYTPIRIKDVWKAQGRYFALLLVPMTWIAAFLILLLWNYHDVTYAFTLLSNQIPNLISQTLQSLTDLKKILPEVPHISQ